MLIIYVDDFKLAGPSQNMNKGWELLTEGIKIGKPEVIDANGTSYLGCIQRRFAGVDSTGRSINTMEYDMKEFVQSCIDRYVEMTEIGSEPRHYATPMLPESMVHQEITNFTCPWCEKGSKLKGNKAIDTVDDDFDGIIGKTFKGRAGKIVMKLLGAARICRYDILKAVTHLASFMSKWEHIHDEKLKRLMEYLARYTQIPTSQDAQQQRSPRRA